MKHVLAACALLLLANMASAQATKSSERCTALASRLSDLAGLQSYLEEVTLKPATCGTALQSGAARAAHCYIGFEYRADHAADTMARLSAQLRACFAASKSEGTDPAVNHPDSFDQRQLCTPYAALSLSLKDKAGLGKTLIFLRSAQSMKQTRPPSSACRS